MASELRPLRPVNTYLSLAKRSFVEPGYGPLGLQLMCAGKDATAALAALIAVDEYARFKANEARSKPQRRPVRRRPLSALKPPMS